MPSLHSVLHIWFSAFVPDPHCHTHCFLNRFLAHFQILSSSHGVYLLACKSQVHQFPLTSGTILTFLSISSLLTVFKQGHCNNSTFLIKFLENGNNSKEKKIYHSKIVCGSISNTEHSICGNDSNKSTIITIMI